MMKKSQEFPFFCRAAEMDFQCLAGPRNVSVDLKYDVLCLWVFVYGIPVWVWRSNGLNFCIGGRNHMLQPYIESATTLSDKLQETTIFRPETDFRHET